MNSLKSEVEAEEIIGYLKHELRLKTIHRQVMARKAIARAAQDYNITISPEEIQFEADQFRYRNRLENASRTFEWLNSQLITAEEWEKGISERLLSKKLAEHLFGQQVETHFAQNKIQYERAILYRLVVRHEPLAQELFYQIEEEEVSFFEAAHIHDVEERRRLACGFEGKLSRWQVSPKLSSMLFGSTPQSLVGVIQSEVGYEIWMAEEFMAAELTTEVRQKISNELFQEWLESEINHYAHA